MHDGLLWLPGLLAQTSPAAPSASPVVEPAPPILSNPPAAGTPAPSAPVTTSTTAATTAPHDGGVAKPDGGIWGQIGGFLPIILMLAVVYIFMMRGSRKEEKRRKELIAELKKGDRVMTIGGLVARVVSIDGDEVVLKIDESANVKATYRKSAIQEVLTAEDKK